MKDDAISRQAAADVVDFECGEWRGLAKTIINKIEALPSAQPEPCDDQRADVYYLAEKIGIHRLYALVVELRGEPEPCEDAVSRADMLETYADLYDVFEDNDQIRKELHKVYDKLNALPSVTLKEQRWIPVTKRLPKNRDWVLGIFQEVDTGWINPIPFICDYIGKKTPITTQDNWLLKLVDEPHPYYEKLRCIAWTPLPELYREEGETDG